MTDMSTISDKSNTSADRVKPDVAGKVRPLRWEQPDGPGDNNSWLGHGTDWCQFYLRKVADEWLLLSDSANDEDAESFASADEAKAAAQADYAARILSALTPDALAPIPAGKVAEMVERLREGQPMWHPNGGSLIESIKRTNIMMREAADLLSRMAGERGVVVPPGKAVMFVDLDQAGDFSTLPVLRCLKSGNPVGTDTHMVGYDCPCANCQTVQRARVEMRERIAALTSQAPK